MESIALSLLAMSDTKAVNRPRAGIPIKNRRMRARIVRNIKRTALLKFRFSSLNIDLEYCLILGSQEWGSNPRPAVYDTAALPTELPWRNDNYTPRA